MKKTFLTLLLVGSGAALFAQNTQADSTSTINNNSSNNSSTNNSTINSTNTTTDPNMSSGTNVNGNQTTNPSTMGATSDSSSGWNNNSTNKSDSTNVNTNNGMNNSSSMSNSNSAMSSTGNYSAYSAATNVPSTVQMSFQKANPSASNARWEQSNDWYRVYYQNNGQDMNAYYDAKGNSFMMALPVMESAVETDVISKLKGMYGTNVYDVTRIKVADHSDAYVVRIIENGQVRSEVVDAQGQAVTQIYRTPESDSIWAANERMKKMGMDSMNMQNGGSNMGIDQSSATTDSSSMNSNHNSTDNNMSTNSNDSMNSNTNNSNDNKTDSTQLHDQNATKTDEIKVKAEDGEIKVKQE